MAPRPACTGTHKDTLKKYWHQAAAEWKEDKPGECGIKSEIQNQLDIF